MTNRARRRQCLSPHRVQVTGNTIILKCLVLEYSTSHSHYCTCTLCMYCPTLLCHPQLGCSHSPKMHCIHLLVYASTSVTCIQHTIITQNGLSALHIAAVMGRTDIVVELVKNGANLNLQNEVCNDIQ